MHLMFELWMRELTDVEVQSVYGADDVFLYGTTGLMDDGDAGGVIMRPSLRSRYDTMSALIDIVSQTAPPFPRPLVHCVHHRIMHSVLCPPVYYDNHPSLSA